MSDLPYLIFAHPRTTHTHTHTRTHELTIATQTIKLSPYMLAFCKNSLVCVSLFLLVSHD
jgi:hypothetical protein